MNEDRDLDRLLDAWFADGPAMAHDRVVEGVASRITRQRQLPAWRLRSWRFPSMSTPLKLVAIGAALLAVLVGGAVFMGGGTRSPTPPPAATPAPTSAPGAFGGTVHYLLDGTPATTEVDAMATGAVVSGTAVTTFGGGAHTVRLACAARDGDTWAVGGTIEQTTVRAAPIGDWSAVIVREGAAQQIAIWLSEDVTAASDCDGWLAGIDLAAMGPENFQAVESGALTPPPDLGP
jgi:hypothetical protein